MARWLVFVGSLFLGSPALAQNADDPSALGIPIEIGRSFTLDSAVMGDERQLNVWLPPEYEQSDKEYTVVYLLDGAVSQDFTHIAGLASLASLSWTFGPMIIVGVETKDRRSELTPPASDKRYIQQFPESGSAAKFRRMLRDEVIPHIEANYRAGGRRALMGESLAGLFVVDTLLREPGSFHDYISISPSLWWDDRRGLSSLNVEQSFRGLTDRRLYLAMADEGGTMQDGVDLLLKGLAGMPSNVLEVKYSDRSSHETHATIYHGAAEDAMRWLYPAPPYDYGPTPWYLIEGASPPMTEGE